MGQGDTDRDKDFNIDTQSNHPLLKPIIGGVRETIRRRTKWTDIIYIASHFEDYGRENAMTIITV